MNAKDDASRYLLDGQVHHDHFHHSSDSSSRRPFNLEDNDHYPHNSYNESLGQDGIDLAKIMNNEENINLHTGKRRRLQSSYGYSFQVDVYIEIDFDLCNRHGESCWNGVGVKTLNYINVLFAGANSVYEVNIRAIFV